LKPFITPYFLISIRFIHLWFKDDQYLFIFLDSNFKDFLSNFDFNSKSLIIFQFNYLILILIQHFLHLIKFFPKFNFQFTFILMSMYRFFIAFPDFFEQNLKFIQKVKIFLRLINWFFHNFNLNFLNSNFFLFLLKFINLKFLFIIFRFFGMNYQDLN
jgi:hypothetical protein